MDPFSLSPNSKMKELAFFVCFQREREKKGLKASVFSTLSLSEFLKTRPININSD